jgi:hypothetical protein
VPHSSQPHRDEWTDAPNSKPSTPHDRTQPDTTRNLNPPPPHNPEATVPDRPGLQSRHHPTQPPAGFSPRDLLLAATPHAQIRSPYASTAQRRSPGSFPSPSNLTNRPQPDTPTRNFNQSNTYEIPPGGVQEPDHAIHLHRFHPRALPAPPMHARARDRRPPLPRHRHAQPVHVLPPPLRRHPHRHPERPLPHRNPRPPRRHPERPYRARRPPRLQPHRPQTSLAPHPNPPAILLQPRPPASPSHHQAHHPTPPPNSSRS